MACFHVLRTRNVRLIEIHRHICEIYGKNIMSEGMMRKWVRQLNEEQNQCV